MVITFDTAFNRLIGHEGGLVDDPQDPGGMTKFGISKRSYPNVDIRNLTLHEAKQIYYRDFWSVLGDDVHSAVKFQVFDAAVNHGIGNALRMLQRAVDVADDGHFGPVSLRAVLAHGVDDVLLRFLAQRIRFMVRLEKFTRYGRGWMERIAGNLQYASEDN